MKAAIGWLIGLVFIVSASAEPLFEGQVRLESGEPVADAQVRIFDLSDLRQGAIARAMTDGTGYFALPLAALGGRALPERFALGPNYPNPFNPSTIIPYQLAASSQVRLEVFNLLGQRITTLVDGERAAGFHTATWHATDGAGRAAGAGVYIYRMTVGVENQTGRMVLLDGQAGLAAGGAASVMPGAAGIGGSDGADAQVYGLIVSGSGLVPYVDSSFRVESGMAPVELVVSSGQYSAGKATDDDCAFCDLFGTFNDQQEEEEDETPEEEEETDSTSSEGGPDLIVQSPSVSAVMLTPGQEFTLNVTVHNQGDGQAAATMLHYYRSNNATITSSDTEVGTDEIGALDASATHAASIALTAPTSVSAEVGIYYGACVASVRGESNTDNNCSPAVKITVSGQESPEEEETEEATEEEGDDTPVTIPDANLRAAIAAALGKARGAPITVTEIKTLNSLDASNFTNGLGIRDLTGLESATNLIELDLPYNTISDLSPLSGLTNLTNLNLRYNTISDLSPLSGLTNLTNLDLTEVKGSLVQGADRYSPLDLSPLSDLANLTNLDLGQNKISDLSPLAGLTNLTNLNLASIHVIWDESNPPPPLDLSPLSGLTNLTNLSLAYNNISDISALSGLINLINLDLSQNKIADISALAGLTELREVFLSVNNISDLAPLAANTGLGSGDIVDVKTNPLNDASIITHISAFQARGVRVSFDEVIALTDPQIYNDNVFVLPVIENLAAGNLPLKNYTARFYEHFNDEFDFLMFVPNLASGQHDPGVDVAAYYAGVKNNVQGIGTSIFSDGSWGSAGKLQGVINFGSNSIYSISDRGQSIVSEGPTLHELMHRWANFIVPSSYGSHWGFSSANGNIGGFDIADLVDHGSGRYSAGNLTVAGVADNVKPYSPIELYLAGFIPPEEVPDLWVAEDGQWLLDGEDRIVRADDGDLIFSTSRVTTYTIEDIIAKHRPRVPDHSQAQKDFRAAVILLISEDYPATREVLETVSRDVSWFSHAGDDESHRYNFYEATRGKGTMAMDGLSQFKSRASAKRLVPSSFGTPPPPIVDHWE